VTASDPGTRQPQSLRSPGQAGSRTRTAAFLDLDHTVIAKSSALAFSKPFMDQGLINRRTVLKSSYAQFLMLLSGADHDQMERMRTHLTNM
jgi:phosphoserine phosphatase